MAGLPNLLRKRFDGICIRRYLEKYHGKLTNTAFRKYP